MQPKTYNEAKRDRILGSPWGCHPYGCGPCGGACGTLGAPGVMARLRSPWAWLLPVALGLAALTGKKKHQPGLALAAAASLLVVNGIRPPGARRFP